MRRADRGGTLTLGFFGGSITQGCAASEDSLCYARRVFRWWEEAFPTASFRYVNGGIGGTGSHFGAARAVEDLLMYQPDVVIVDFSVNDTPGPLARETYEGLLRRLLTWPSRPAVVLLNNVYYDSGVSAQEDHNAVGDWYGLPHVSIRDTVFRRMQAGEYTLAQLTGDGLHPNDFGHGLLAAELTAFLAEVRAHLEEPEEEAPLPPPMTANACEHARRLTIREASPQLAGFLPDAREKTGHLDCFKNGWIGQRPGDAIRFTVEASCIAVQYRKTVARPALKARLVLDGGQLLLLDGSFDEEWGDCLYLQPVLHHGPRCLHTLELTVAPSEEAGAAPFYLLSLIVS